MIPTLAARRRASVPIVLLGLALLLAGGVTATTSAASATVVPGRSNAGFVHLVNACRTARPGYASCESIHVVHTATRVAGSVPAASVALPSNLVTGPQGGYTPALLASAYGYNPAWTAGSTQTVAIVDAYQDPNITDDLNTFDHYYGLPSESTSSFRVVSQTGSLPTTVPLDTTGWSLEQSLDVEAVRAVCQKCKILLVEANSQSATNLATGVREAAQLGATEISNSYGIPEAGLPNLTSSNAKERADASWLASSYRIPHVVVTAAAGDDGWYGWDQINAGQPTDGGAVFPAEYNSVVGVGGTSMQVYESGSWAQETVWNSNGRDDSVGASAAKALGASGGGCGTEVAAPIYQGNIAGYGSLGCTGKRSTVDIAADADPYTGLDTYSSYSFGTNAATGWMTSGGTSLSSPLIAAMWALDGGSRGLAYPALALYGHEKSRVATHDITVGGNDACGGDQPASCASAALWQGAPSPNIEVGGLVACGWSANGATVLPNHNQCYATRGYDGPTGVGSPNGISTFTPLSPNAAISVPRITHGHSAVLSGASSSDPYPGGRITFWSWSFGDGHDAAGARPSHVWARAGYYTVTLTVTDNFGVRSARRSVRVRVY